jgi:hypothetical protein
VITPEMEKALQKQVSMLGDPSSRVRGEAMLVIRKYGRFSEPILKRILENERNEPMRKRIKEVIELTASKQPNS